MYLNWSAGGKISGSQVLANRRRCNDIAKLTMAVKDCSAVVHLAGLVGDPACAVNPEFTSHTNIISTRMVREVAEAMGVYRFVFASSCSVYGASDRRRPTAHEVGPASQAASTATMP